MDNKVNYTVVGIFVVVLGVAFVVMLFWLSSARHDKVYNTYYTYVHEDVTGLSLEGPVRFNGVQVGYVEKIQLDPINPQLVKLTLKLQQGTPVTASTVITLMPMGITGVVYVSLKAKTPHALMLKPRPGEKYPVIPFQPSFLMQLGNVLPELTTNLKEIGESLSKVLDEKNRQAISASLQNISVVTKNLSNNSHKLDAITDSLQETLKNTAEASKQFPELLDEVHKTMQRVQQTGVDISAAGKSARLLMSQGRIMIGGINDQLLPSVQQMVVKLNSAMLNVVNVTEEVQRNPSMFIRGRQPTLPGPGELGR